MWGGGGLKCSLLAKSSPQFLLLFDLINTKHNQCINNKGINALEQNVQQAQLQGRGELKCILMAKIVALDYAVVVTWRFPIMHIS